MCAGKKERLTLNGIWTRPTYDREVNRGLLRLQSSPLSQLRERWQNFLDHTAQFCQTNGDQLQRRGCLSVSNWLVYSQLTDNYNQCLVTSIVNANLPFYVNYYDYLEGPSVSVITFRARRRCAATNRWMLLLQQRRIGTLFIKSN